ncbi:MAG TPA: MFS transporter [Acidobacteriaceae bacterium]|nr:MFS transporter [Acidobacteriaceae bacterium]
MRSRTTLWLPTVSMLLLSLISYMDRSVLAILSPTILRDLHLSATEYGFAISVFSICYMIANPIWGLWMDKRGIFATAILAVAIWTLAAAAHAFIGHWFLPGILGLCLGRGLLGFGEGATFPAGLKTVTETLPVSRRAFGLGLAYSGGSLGALLTPLLITPLAARYGWRAAFLLTASAGLLWLLFWLWMHHAGFYQFHPHAEVTPATHKHRFSFSLLNVPLFGTVAVYGLGAAPLVFGLYAAPLYLSRVLHESQTTLGHLLWIPPAGWELGYLVWGRIVDRRALRLRSGQALQGSERPVGLFAGLAAFGVVLAAIPMVAGATHALLLTMLMFFAAMFVAGGFVVLSLADGLTRQPAASAGFLAGFCISCWALVTAFVMPAVGRMFDAQRYGASFLFMACIPPAGVLLWWWLTGIKPSGLSN